MLTNAERTAREKRAKQFTELKITEINKNDAFKLILDVLADNGLHSDVPLLPILFNLKGKPFTLKNHFQMAPLFEFKLPPNITLKTGRQVSKSMSNAAQSIMLAYSIPYFNILHVTPLREQVERFSANYVAPLLKDSPVQGLFLDKKCSKKILERSLKSGSILYFSYAFNDCDRTRGINANAIKYDEVQDLDPSFIPIISSSLDGVRSGKDLYSAGSKSNEPLVVSLGTPKTLENGLEQLWETSSQGEWAIPCRKCKHLNIPSLRADLEAMMGPKYRKEEVSPETPGIVCAKCGHYLYTADGCWTHNFPERRGSHPGYHLPQIVMNYHCEDNTAWTELQNKRFNRTKMAQATFYNEVCGESYDHGQKLISVTDLRSAAVLPPKTDMPTHIKWIQSGRYKDWGVGVDWGGGGMSGLSKTAFAVGGLRADGIIEIFTGHRSDHPNNYNLEASRTKDIMNTFNCRFCAMDFQGAGRLRYQKLLDVQLDRRLIYPFEYYRVGNGAICKKAAADGKEGLPVRFQVNKARAFLLLSEYIRCGRVRFFEYDYIDADRPGLLRDFTALAEDRVDLKERGEVYTVIPAAGAGPDDFANACNYLVNGLFVRNGYPDAGSILTLADLSEEQQDALNPAWRDTNFNWFYEN